MIHRNHVVDETLIAEQTEVMSMKEMFDAYAKTGTLPPVGQSAGVGIYDSPELHDGDLRHYDMFQHSAVIRDSDKIDQTQRMRMQAAQAQQSPDPAGSTDPDKQSPDPAGSTDPDKQTSSED